MKIRVISKRNEIFDVLPSERLIHVAYRPSSKDIFNIVEQCPKLEVIQIPKSYKRSMSKSIQLFLSMQKIQVVEGDVWGHRKDLSEYFLIDDSALERVKEMRDAGSSDWEICGEVGKRNHISEGVVKYLVGKV